MYILLKDSNPLEFCEKHEALRNYTQDPGFLHNIKLLKKSQTDADAANLALKDPRIMQTIAAMQNQTINVTKEDLAAAQINGDIPKIHPVQKMHIDEAEKHTTIQQARQAGNSHHMVKRYPYAIACYQRVLQLLANSTVQDIHSSESHSSSDEISTCMHANIAAAFIKLRCPHDALRSCEQALSLCDQIDSGGNNLKTKVHYRVAQAYEMLQDFGKAVEAIEKASLSSNDGSKFLSSEVARFRKLQAKSIRRAEKGRMQ